VADPKAWLENLQNGIQPFDDGTFLDRFTSYCKPEYVDYFLDEFFWNAVNGEL